MVVRARRLDLEVVRERQHLDVDGRERREVARLPRELRDAVDGLGGRPPRLEAEREGREARSALGVLDLGQHLRRGPEVVGVGLERGAAAPY